MVSQWLQLPGGQLLLARTQPPVGIMMPRDGPWPAVSRGRRALGPSCFRHGFKDAGPQGQLRRAECPLGRGGQIAASECFGGQQMTHYKCRYINKAKQTV